MIAASEPQEFVPYGRQQVLEHPGDAVGTDQRQQSEAALLNQLSEVAISDDYRHSESWTLRYSVIGEAPCEEELYFKGKTAVWSIGPDAVEDLSGNKRGNRILKCCYTSESNIKQVLWCNFHITSVDVLSNINPSYKTVNLNLNKIVENEDIKLKDCICVMDDSHLKFYTKHGQEFMTTLQFQVSKVWKTKFGLLIERVVNRKKEIKNKSVTKPSVTLQRCKINSKNIDESDLSHYSSIQYSSVATLISNTFMNNELNCDNDLPKIFSLSHPLDEICPVLMKQDDTNLTYMSDPEVTIVMTDEDECMCMMFNNKTKCHIIYTVRRAEQHEAAACVQHESIHQSKLQQTNCSYNYNSFNVHNSNVSLPAFLNNRTRKSLGLAQTFFPNIGNSPLNYSDVRHSSPVTSTHSPLSPCFTHVSYTPPSYKKLNQDSSLLSSNNNTPSRMENRMMTDDVNNVSPKPLYPQICLKYEWAEQANTSNTKAKKGFIVKDWLDNSLLCYLIQENKTLNMLKIEKISTRVSYTFVASLTARDAEYVPSMKIIAVINMEGGVELYTGTQLIGKLLATGICGTSSTYLSSTTSIAPSYHTVSFPRRSSLLPCSSSPVATFDESLSQFSPVPSMDSLQTPTSVAAVSIVPREGLLVGLRDGVANRISLEYSTGLLFRFELPDFCKSPLVTCCLDALKHVLPQHLALQVLVKWYCVRNVPGSENIDDEEEWKIFTRVLLGMLGYDMDKLNREENSKEDNSPVTRPKKRKTTDLPSNNDWFYLTNSKHHQQCKHVVVKISEEGGCGQDEELLEDTSTDTTPHSSILSNTNKTPLDRSKYQHRNVRSYLSERASSLNSIDETPSLQTAKVSRLRFHNTLDKGDYEEQSSTTSNIEDSQLNKKAILYKESPVVLFALHLLYEDMKLNTLQHKFLSTLCVLLYLLAKDLRLSRYLHHYWLDFPTLCPAIGEKITRENVDLPPFVTEAPPNIFHLFHRMVLKQTFNPYPHIRGLNKRSKDLVQVIGLLCYGQDDPDMSVSRLIRILPLGSPREVGKTGFHRERVSRPIQHRVLLLMAHKGITRDDLQTFPPGLSLIIHEALYYCRETPDCNWNREMYRLAMRQDLASLCRHADRKEVGPTNELILPSGGTNFKSGTGTTTSSSGSGGGGRSSSSDTDEDGMEELVNLDVLKLRFSNDQRVLEARRLLQSAHPVSITIQQRPDVSDHEFIQQQEKHLYVICTRTVALPIGRGMVTLRTSTPVVNEPLPIPTLCLTGRVPPTDKVVDMSHIEVVANMNVWPLFHNGVAAGLRISPNAVDIDSHWIIYNRPKNNNDELIEHAGFLMALGLNGHLRHLKDCNVYQYLIKSHEMTSVGLLLGMAASKRGTMDVTAVKLMSIHIEAMLPPTGIELDVDVIVEPAALIGLGFLFQGTTHRHIAQVLLQEIGRPPGPEMENSVDRESYSLAAGLALGLVAFGKGSKLSGLGDLAVPDTLHHYMVGGPKRPYLGSQREKYKTQSYLIWEGDLVNTNVTGPGATLALGMIYFNTGNRAIVDWLEPPETLHLLEMVLPDALLLRTLAKCLIMWSAIEPSEEWLLKHIPEFIRQYCLVKPQGNSEEEIDYETINQAYCNIIAGACMAMGLRYAGSANEEAFQILLSHAKQFTSMLNKSVGEVCGRSTVETCLSVIVVSLAMVMSGTGDVEVLRLCRYLRSRVGPANTVVTYGSHVSTHMAIGLLFIGGGSHTLSTAPDAIAALLCAFYPKWPIHSNDNRYHLQALRHLYVLAAEPRLLLPRDIDTRTLCYVHITAVYLNSKECVRVRAPCLLPELDLLTEVRIEDERYWSIVFTRNKNWDDFKQILSECSFIDVKPRAGRLSYIQDPQGYKSLLSEALISDHVVPWCVNVESIFAFSSDPLLVNFAQYFLTERSDVEPVNSWEEKMSPWLTSVSYYCLTKDKLALLPLWISLLKLQLSLVNEATVGAVWQLKLVWSHCLNNQTKLLPAEMALTDKQHFLKLTGVWEESDLLRYLRQLLEGDVKIPAAVLNFLTSYLIAHEFPPLTELRAVFSDGKLQKPSSILTELIQNGVSPSTAMKLIKIMK